MKTRDILGLGCATIDELLFVDAYPAPDGKVLVTQSQTQGGGLTATALVAGARLGASCAYGGMLGFDATSRQVARILESENVDVSLVSWRTEAAAIRSTIIVDQSAHTRAIFFQKPGWVGAALDAPPAGAIAQSRVLLIDHYGGAGNARAARIARENGVPIVADFERRDVPHWDEFFSARRPFDCRPKFRRAIMRRTIARRSRARIMESGARSRRGYGGRKRRLRVRWNGGDSRCGVARRNRRYDRLRRRFSRRLRGDFSVELAAHQTFEVGERGGVTQSPPCRRAKRHREFRRGARARRKRDLKPRII